MLQLGRNGRQPSIPHTLALLQVEAAGKGSVCSVILRQHRDCLQRRVQQCSSTLSFSQRHSISELQHAPI